MFIQTQETPNPATLKFMPGRDVSATPIDFADADTAARSPLAEKLFAIDGVKGVMFGADFITVTRGDVDWRHLKPPVLAAIMDHFVAGEPLLREGAAAAETGEGDDEIVVQIKELLETRVRPAVAQDGGDITFHKFDAESGIVFLHMKGACSGCPSSTLTLKSGIENLLRHYVPEVRQVQQI